ncbi:MAG TPA: hypothetical protein VG125_13250 [Pirellulales bacterium]|nr:hypothetical protein [Pirellulales bacterium]
MIVCLDANIVIYYVERNPLWEPKVAASAIEHACGLFLTNDAQLSRCSAIPVEVLT